MEGEVDEGYENAQADKIKEMKNQADKIKELEQDSCEARCQF